MALGTPLKVASLLSHLSGFEQSVALACPSLEERIKYTFNLQPVDLVALPMMGEYNALYAKCVLNLPTVIYRRIASSGTLKVAIFFKVFWGGKVDLNAKILGTETPFSAY